MKAYYKHIRDIKALQKRVETELPTDAPSVETKKILVSVLILIEQILHDCKIAKKKKFKSNSK